MSVKHPAQLVVMALMVIALSSTAIAQGRGNGNGNGGGNDPPPSGTIYFRHDAATWTMNPDGTGAAALVNAPSHGEPSHAKHDNQRWFLVSTHIEPPAFPNGGPDVEISAQSENGLFVLLLREPDIEVLSPPTWTDGDESVSFIGERWGLDAGGEPTEVVEAGVYRFDVVYDASGAVQGMVPGSFSIVADLSSEIRSGPAGFDTRNEVAGHSWSADQSQFAFAIRTWEFESEIWIVDLSLVSDPLEVPSDALRLLDSGDGIGWPDWSPDGRRIGYVSWSGTVVYDLVKDRIKILRDNHNISWGRTIWAPSGSHFVTHQWDKISQNYAGIYRFNSGLTDQTLLTEGLCDPGSSCTLLPTGWRE